MIIKNVLESFRSAIFRQEQITLLSFKHILVQAEKENPESAKVPHTLHQNRLIPLHSIWDYQGTADSHKTAETPGNHSGAFLQDCAISTAKKHLQLTSLFLPLLEHPSLPPWVLCIIFNQYCHACRPYSYLVMLVPNCLYRHNTLEIPVLHPIRIAMNRHNS